MNDIIDMILTFMFWYAIGWFLFNFLVAPWLKDRLEGRIREMEQEIEDIKKVYKRVKIEEYDGIFYVFDVETNEFLGQGRTAEEFAERLKKDLVLQPVEGDADVIARFRKTVPQTDLV